MQKIGLLAAVLISFVAAAPASATGEAAKQPTHATKSVHKLVLQVSDVDPGKWNLALNNAENVQSDLGAKNVKIEIVAYGPGIGMLKSDSVVGNRIQDAIAAGIEVAACQTTMRKAKLTKDDMLPKLAYVPSGVVELMKREREGYAYIRP